MSPHMEDGSDPAQWARQVVADLSSTSVSHWIWRGKFSTMVRLSNILPVGMLDGVRKRLVGMDKVERKLKADLRPT